MNDSQRGFEHTNALIGMVVLEKDDFVAFHLGEHPSQEFIDASKAAVLKAWGEDVPVLFVAGPVVMTVVRGVEREL